MKKPVLQNAVVILGGYIMLALVANIASGVVVQYMPTVLLFGLLTTAMFMGYSISRENKKWIDRLFVAIPYLLGIGCYTIARVSQSSEWIKIYRTIVPTAYAQLNLMKKVTFEIFQPDVLVVITLFLAALLTYGGIKLGMIVKDGNTTAKKLIYNNVLLWGVHFYIMALLGQLVIQNPTLQMDDSQRMLSGGIVTVVIFVAYFLVGKISKDLERHWLQMVSTMSVTVTALGMYIASLFLIYPSGRYEVYVLPVAHSFFGVMGKALALRLGATAEFISQYGILVSVLLMFIPVVLVYVGKLASRQEGKQVAQVSTVEE